VSTWLFPSCWSQWLKAALLLLRRPIADSFEELSFELELELEL
jgi:hypothetical protein